MATRIAPCRGGPHGAPRGGHRGDAVVKLRGRVTGGREGSSEREPTNPYIADNIRLNGGPARGGPPRPEGGPWGALSPRRMHRRRTAASPQNDLLFARVVAQRTQQQQLLLQQQQKLLQQHEAPAVSGQELQIGAPQGGPPCAAANGTPDPQSRTPTDAPRPLF